MNLCFKIQNILWLFFLSCSWNGNIPQKIIRYFSLSNLWSLFYFLRCSSWYWLALEIIWKSRHFIFTKSIPCMTLSWLIFRFFLHTTSNTANIECDFLCFELIFINFEIFDLIFILFELFVSFHLIVQMRKDFIVNSEFKRLTLLNYI